MSAETPDPRPDDFKLPGGTLTYGEVCEQFGKPFADKAFAVMERIQAGEASKAELFDLYFDFVSQEEGIDHIVLGAGEAKVHHADPDAEEKLEVKPMAKGGDE